MERQKKYNNNNEGDKAENIQNEIRKAWKEERSTENEAIKKRNTTFIDNRWVEEIKIRKERKKKSIKWTCCLGNFLLHGRRAWTENGETQSAGQYAWSRSQEPSAQQVSVPWTLVEVMSVISACDSRVAMFLHYSPQWVTHYIDRFGEIPPRRDTDRTAKR
jgi:hypothetical protein